MFACLKGAAAAHGAPLELYLSALSVDTISCNSLFSRSAQWDPGDVCRIRSLQKQSLVFEPNSVQFLTFVRDISNLISC